MEQQGKSLFDDNANSVYLRKSWLTTLPQLWIFQNISRPHIFSDKSLYINDLTFSRPHVTPHVTPHVRPHLTPHVRPLFRVCQNRHILNRECEGGWWNSEGGSNALRTVLKVWCRKYFILHHFLLAFGEHFLRRISSFIHQNLRQRFKLSLQQLQLVANRHQGFQYVVASV